MCRNKAFLTNGWSFLQAFLSWASLLRAIPDMFKVPGRDQAGRAVSKGRPQAPPAPLLSQLAAHAPCSQRATPPGGPTGLTWPPPSQGPHCGLHFPVTPRCREVKAQAWGYTTVQCCTERPGQALPADACTPVPLASAEVGGIRPAAQNLGSCLVRRTTLILFFFFFFKIFIYLFMTQRERDRDTGSGRSRLHAGSPTQDSTPGLQDHTLG